MLAPRRSHSWLTQAPIHFPEFLSFYVGQSAPGEAVCGPFCYFREKVSPSTYQSPSQASLSTQEASVLAVLGPRVALTLGLDLGRPCVISPHSEGH